MTKIALFGVSILLFALGVASAAIQPVDGQESAMGLSRASAFSERTGEGRVDFSDRPGVHLSAALRSISVGAHRQPFQSLGAETFNSPSSI